VIHGRQQRRRWITASLLLLAALVIAAPVLLRALYGWLVVNQSAAGCDRLMIVTPTPGCFESAVEIVSGGLADEVIVPGGRLTRPELIGATDPQMTLWKRQLVTLGIPANKIRTVPTSAWTPHEMFQQIDQSLPPSGDDKFQVVATATLSRYYRLVIDQALPAQRARAYVVTAVSPKPADSSTWYRSRRDLKRVFHHGLCTLFVAVQGASEVTKDDPYDHLYTSLAVR